MIASDSQFGQAGGMVLDALRMPKKVSERGEMTKRAGAGPARPEMYQNLDSPEVRQSLGGEHRDDVDFYLLVAAAGFPQPVCRPPEDKPY